jgi:hypothetical protein
VEESGAAGWLARLLEAVPEPAFFLTDELQVLHPNAAAVRFFSLVAPACPPLGELLQCSGVEFEGVPLPEALGALAGREPAGGLLRFQVRRGGEDAERLIFLSRVEGLAPVVWSCCVEGGVAREDLVQLRAKAREAAHAVNNVAMKAVGNVSLARMRASAMKEVVASLDAAERNLLEMREITRELQQIAKKELPAS